MPSTATVATAPSPSSRQLALAGMALIGVCYGLARFAYGLFVPELRAAFDLGPALVGVIGAGSSLGYLLAVVASFLATERYGPRAVAIAAGAVATAGMGLVAAAPGPPALAAGVLLAGASSGLASPPLAAAITRLVAAPCRGRLQTVINAGTGLGVLLSAPIALFAAGLWRAAWAGFALAAAAVTLWIARTLPARTGRDGAPSLSADRSARRWQVGTARMALAALVMGAASTTVWVFGRDVATSAGGLSPAGAAWLWVMIGVAGLGGAFAGDLVRRFGLATAWLATMPAFGGAILVFGLLPGTGTLFVATAAFGALYIALTGILLVWGTRTHSTAPATGVGVAFLAIALGQMLAAPLVGVLVTSMGPAMTFAAAAAVAATGGLLRPCAPPRTPLTPACRPR